KNLNRERKLKMGTKLKILVMIVGILVISACSNDNTQSEAEMDEMDHSTMDQDTMDEHMSHDEVISLNDSTGENELNIPPMLEPDHRDDTQVEYTVRAQKGKTEIFDGTETATYGYNGSFLGPTLRFENGDQVKIRTINELDEATTFHWHGLEVSADADGGPHDVIKPGEEKVIEFEVTQEASTLWFHPHPEGKT